MASILLPPCITAKSLVTASIPIATSSIALAAGYAGGIAVVVTNLATATATLNGVITTLTPAAAVAPPARIGLNTVGAAITQIVTINASITAASSAAAVPATLVSAFPAAAALVVTQLVALDVYIGTILITPQL